MERKRYGRKEADKKVIYDHSLHLVTDRIWTGSNTLSSKVEQAILGGCTVVQLRDAAVSDRDFYRLAIKLREITDRYRIPLVINNRMDIALAAGAAGVHIGQKDLPLSAVRKNGGENMCIGVSVVSVKEAVEAEMGGADYLGVGAIFPTKSKQDARPVSLEKLQEIRQAVHIPVVAIGGINRANAGIFREMGIDGIAVISAITSRTDIARATTELKEAFWSGRSSEWT